MKMKRNFTFVCTDENCGENFDALVDEKEESHQYCPKCGKHARKTFAGCGSFKMKGKYTAANSYGLKG